jgi:iron(III) transport system substrate-binding protein
MRAFSRIVTRTFFATGMAAAALAMAPASAQAQGALTLYCAVQEEWCRAMTTAFEKETGIKVSMTRKSSGEIYAQIKAESSNPRGDVWWGGTGDPHLQAAEEGLTQENSPAKPGDLNDWALSVWKSRASATIPRPSRPARCLSRSAGLIS